MTAPIQLAQGDMGHVLYAVPVDVVQARAYLEAFGEDRVYHAGGVKYRREAGTRNYVPWHKRGG